MKLRMHRPSTASYSNGQQYVLQVGMTARKKCTYNGYDVQERGNSRITYG